MEQEEKGEIGILEQLLLVRKPGPKQRLEKGGLGTPPA
jgi:hypothetical protein